VRAAKQSSRSHPDRFVMFWCGSTNGWTEMGKDVYRLPTFDFDGRIPGWSVYLAARIPDA
jgi:hypothetical protein